MTILEIAENALYNFKTFAKQDPWPAKNPMFLVGIEQLEAVISKLIEIEEGGK